MMMANNIENLCCTDLRNGHPENRRYLMEDINKGFEEFGPIVEIMTNLNLVNRNDANAKFLSDFVQFRHLWAHKRVSDMRLLQMVCAFVMRCREVLEIQPISHSPASTVTMLKEFARMVDINFYECAKWSLNATRKNNQFAHHVTKYLNDEANKSTFDYYSFSILKDNKNSILVEKIKKFDDDWIKKFEEKGHLSHHQQYTKFLKNCKSYLEKMKEKKIEIKNAEIILNEMIKKLSFDDYLSFKEKNGCICVAENNIFDTYWLKNKMKKLKNELDNFNKRINKSKEFQKCCEELNKSVEFQKCCEELNISVEFQKCCKELNISVEFQKCCEKLNKSVEFQKCCEELNISEEFKKCCEELNISEEFKKCCNELNNIVNDTYNNTKFITDLNTMITNDVRDSLNNVQKFQCNQNENSFTAAVNELRRAIDDPDNNDNLTFLMQNLSQEDKNSPLFAEKFVDQLDTDVKEKNQNIDLMNKAKNAKSLSDWSDEMNNRVSASSKKLDFLQDSKTKLEISYITFTFDMLNKMKGVDELEDKSVRLQAHIALVKKCEEWLGKIEKAADNKTKAVKDLNICMVQLKEFQFEFNLNADTVEVKLGNDSKETFNDAWLNQIKNKVTELENDGQLLLFQKNIQFLSQCADFMKQKSNDDAKKLNGPALKNYYFTQKNNYIIINEIFGDVWLKKIYKKVKKSSVTYKDDEIGQLKQKHKFANGY